jgi:hypothetical protein
LLRLILLGFALKSLGVFIKCLLSDFLGLGGGDWFSSKQASSLSGSFLIFTEGLYAIIWISLCGFGWVGCANELLRIDP